MERVRELVRKAHLKLCPGVPLVGWDVAITEEAGICLLEANLSCNFFRASFDRAAYSHSRDVVGYRLYAIAGTNNAPTGGEGGWPPIERQLAAIGGRGAR